MAATVLICDNEAPLRMLVRASLEDRGYAIVEAENGDDALRLARELRPDLVVLDVMMPSRSGLSVLTELRADEQLAATRVLMLTASARVPGLAAGAVAGPDGVLAKPFSPLELARVVDELVANR